MKWILKKFLKNIPDRYYLKLRYFFSIGKRLDLKNPKTFNEKLQWLKINDRKNEYSIMVDKYEVKSYVSNIIGNEYIIPTYGIWDNFDEIDFENLPMEFVLKCTHDSGGLVICKDKNTFNKKKARCKINVSLKQNYYYFGREWPYKDVKPRIIAEKYMTEDRKDELIDYKLHCFNGKVKLVLVCTNRFSDLEETFFDEKWNCLELKRPNHNINPSIKKPMNYEKMKVFAEKLAKDIPFIRVDFYEADNKLYFGELTFYPSSGFSKFIPLDWDEKLGNMLKLPI